MNIIHIFVLFGFMITFSLNMGEVNYFLKIANNDKGEYITDKSGRALYIFENDKPNISNCSEECIKRWIPFLPGNTVFPPDVAEKLNSNAVGLFQRKMGVFQITYNKRPLYYFAGDKGSETNGHKLKEFNGRWSLLKSDGSALDSRLSNSITNIPNPRQINVVIPGIASVLIQPDSFKLNINITETNTTIVQSVANIKNILNELINATAIDSNQIELIDKIIDNNSLVSFCYKLNILEQEKVVNICNKIREINSKFISEKISISVNFAVSTDLISKIHSDIYNMAINDSLTNTNKVLSLYNLAVNSGDSIRSINADSYDLHNVNPLIKGQYGSQVMTIKITVNYNAMKKNPI